jgi:hypothetical protein
VKNLAIGSLFLQILGSDISIVMAENEKSSTPTTATATQPIATSIDSIPKVPLYTKKTSDLQPYTDIPRGFKLLR